MRRALGIVQQGTFRLARSHAYAPDDRGVENWVCGLFNSVWGDEGEQKIRELLWSRAKGKPASPKQASISNSIAAPKALTLDPAAPLDNARIFAELNYRTDEIGTLWCHQGQF